MDCGLLTLIGQAAEDVTLPVIVGLLIIGGGGWLLWVFADESHRLIIALWVFLLGFGLTLVLIALRTGQIWLSTC